MTTVEVLERARGLIAKGWSQGASARDAQGREVRRTAADAAKWCAIGALHAEEHCADRRACRIFANVIGRSVFLIDDWNDETGRTQTEVLAAFDKAIALARAEVKP